MKAETFQRSFLLILVAVISFVFLWMIRSFLIPMFLAAIFSSLLRPLYLKIYLRTKKRESLSAGLSLLAFILLIMLPLFGFLGIVAKEAVNVTETVAPWVQEKINNKEEFHKTLQKFPGSTYIAPYSQKILDNVGSAVSGVGNFIFKGVSSLTAGTLFFFIDLGVMLYAMFFFLIDGPEILKKVLFYMPLQNRDENRLINGFRAMAWATIKSMFVIGAVQGVLAGVAFWVAGIPSSLFWGTVMAVLSMIPNVGAALVWVPGCIFLFIKGDSTAAILLFVWCAFVVGTADNFLKPILVGKDTEVPHLLILVSTLGGLSMLGLSGFILGPVLALLFVTIWDIYGVTFKDILPKID